MTAYTILGIRVDRNLADQVISVTDTALFIEMPDGVLPTLTYSFETPSDPTPDPDELLPLIEGSAPGSLDVDLFGPDLSEIDETSLGFIEFSGTGSIVLAFTEVNPGAPAIDFIFSLGGSSVPDFVGANNPVAAFNNFDSAITNGGAITSGPFGPGSSIPLDGLRSTIAYTGEERTVFSAADDDIVTGAGNDLVEVGGGGFDDVSTLAGDDMVIVDGTATYTEAVVDLGTGRDILDLIDIGTTGSYVRLTHDDLLTEGINLRIDAPADIGRIDKGAGGSTVIFNAQAAILEGGLGFSGSAFADVLNVTSIEDGFVQVGGKAGADVFNLDISDGGTLRLDYRHDGGPGGIVADLSSGIIQDSHGDTDTVNGQFTEFRSTMGTDDITGTNGDERFILMAGSDTLDGGGGFDTVRYDRSRVEAVTVDLATGTATGVWRGETFNHVLQNVEAVRGSRNDNDTLSGDAGDNLLYGRGGDDMLAGRGGDDTLIGGDGNDTLDGGTGFDVAEFFDFTSDSVTISQLTSGDVQVVTATGTDILIDVEELLFSDTTVRTSDLFPEEGSVVGSTGDDTLSGTESDETLTAGGGADVVDGGAGDDTIDGGSGNDTLRGGEGADSIDGGDGTDTINGGEGDDVLSGGESENDRRDVIFGGSGDDLIRGGFGNDAIYGMEGNDTLAGGFGVDDLQGQDGDDVITGSAFSDLVFGGAGDDFVNGGFGFDRINGGTGADKFFHAGADGHGSDWIQDYNAAEGDVLLFGIAGASVSDFVVRTTHTASADGERAGDDSIEEAFINYRGQTLWALVDGAGQTEINLQIGGEVFDLLA